VFNIFAIPVIGPMLGILLGLGVIYAGSAGYQVVQNYTNLSGQIEKLQDEKRLWEGRENSHKRMIERRDAAIEASKCSVVIKEWIRKPDSIPEKFAPFKERG
jgi:hypothetical protein